MLSYIGSPWQIAVIVSTSSTDSLEANWNRPRSYDEFASGSARLHVRVGLLDLIEVVAAVDGHRGGPISDGVEELLKHG